MVVRTQRVPVAEVVGGGTKSEFYASLREHLNKARAAANIATNVLVKNDDWSERNPKKQKAPYQAIASMFEGSSAVASYIARDVRSKYYKTRPKALVGRSVFQNVRSFPWHLKNDSGGKTFWLSVVDGNVIAKITLGDKKWDLRLAGGSNYRRQLSTLKKAIENNTFGGSQIYLDKSGRAILAISCRLEVRQSPKRIAGSVARVYSSKDSIVNISFPGWLRPFVVDCSDVITWKAESTRRNFEFRQARKRGGNLERIREASRSVAIKSQNRLKTKAHTLAAIVADKCFRLGIETVELDLSSRLFCKSFPWFDLETKIKEKLEIIGVEVKEVTHSAGDADPNQPHVYFVLPMPITDRVKIGKSKGNNRKNAAKTSLGEDTLTLAIANYPASKVFQMESHFKNMFDRYRFTGRKEQGNEVFVAEPVIEFLREVDWLGNTGNLSQILDVLGLTDVKSRGGHLQADSDGPEILVSVDRSQNAVKGQGYLWDSIAAPEVTDRSIKN